MKITAYKLNDNAFDLVPASVNRDWMTNSSNKFAYRCLPLLIGNGYGWELRSNSEFIAQYKGGNTQQDIEITNLCGTNFPTSHFGEGVITWHVGYLFKTEYPYGLYVTGPPNTKYLNIIPLTGIVETYWLPFTFTMNWKFMGPGGIHIKPGDIICQIFPVDMTMFDNVEAEIVPINNDPEMLKQFTEWSTSRGKFLSNLESKNASSWQKNYFRGTHPDKDEIIETHKTNLNVPEFKIKND